MTTVKIDNETWETVKNNGGYDLKITVPERTGDDSDAKAVLKAAERDKKLVDEEILTLQARSTALQQRIDGLKAILVDLGA